MSYCKHYCERHARHSGRSPVRLAGPRTEWRDSRSVGGCTGCSRHVTPHGETAHLVLVIEGETNGSLTARYCEQCVAQIVVAAQAHKPAPQRGLHA